MGVKITINPTLRKFTQGKNIVEVNGCSTVIECLKELEKRYPEIKHELWDDKGELAHCFLLLINGKPIHSNTIYASVKDGDKIDLIYIVGGG